VTGTVVIGTFDGVHLGHRRVLEVALETGSPVTALTFHPHPRTVVHGNQVELICSPERRVELLREHGAADVVVIPFTLETAAQAPEQFVADHLAGAQVVVAGEDFRFGHRRSGDLGTLERLGFEVRRVPLVDGISSSEIRRLVHEGELAGAASLLGRPFELDGVVVPGDQRGGTLGYPTANLALDPALLVPRFGIYAGAARAPDQQQYRAAISIGINPHYGGQERRIEPHLLDFEGDLYGQRLVVELWERLRDERAFASEEELVAQIARDVERTRAVSRPA
jgi:riboflavin kinase / FMN adenylyltransferase